MVHHLIGNGPSNDLHQNSLNLCARPSHITPNFRSNVVVVCFLRKKIECVQKITVPFLFHWHMWLLQELCQYAISRTIEACEMNLIWLYRYSCICSEITISNYMGQLLMLINLDSTFPFLIGLFFPLSFVGASLPPAYIRTRLHCVVRVRRALMAYFDDLRTHFIS